jgi:hypothetical protein
MITVNEEDYENDKGTEDENDDEDKENDSPALHSGLKFNFLKDKEQC